MKWRLAERKLLRRFTKHIMECSPTITECNQCRLGNQMRGICISLTIFNGRSKCIMSNKRLLLDTTLQNNISNSSYSYNNNNNNDSYSYNNSSSYSQNDDSYSNKNSFRYITSCRGKRQLMEQQKLIQEQNFQREMMEKQRQQRKAFESTPVNNHQQNVVVPQSTSWPRDTTYQNSQGNLQSSIKVDSKPASPGQAAELSAYYSKMPGTPQTNYERNNVATGPEIKAYSMDWSKKTNLIGSPLHDSQVKRIPMKEHLPRVSVSQAAIPTWQQSDLNRVLPSSNKNVTNLTLTPLQDKQKDFRVSYQPTNQITSRGVNLNPTSQSQYRISPSISSQLKAGSLLNAPLKKEPAPLLEQKADFSSASSIFQTNNRSTPSMKSKQELNKTSQVEKRGDVEDGSQPQDEPPKKKEKLFYFPIKRDTLIRLLPMNLQAKYRSLRETRNINSSYEAFSNKEKKTPQFWKT
ncbi:hypothetical protein OS493_003836 [Desmophyllum pertusum]|uniref:Uncharacterized protein n=1 Tax=Desmophyllum pertusum TaxID=174260 RepID=A0A9X0A6C1_9CNID|nr:hypothetical protein OS493_003836 [Desmophyllum pertusum]